MRDNGTKAGHSLSVEAQVVAASLFMFMSDNQSVTFKRPWIIHPRTRKGLDGLTRAGYLTCEPLNTFKDCPLTWRATAAMRTLKKAPMSFVQANSFPITTE